MINYAALLHKYFIVIQLHCLYLSVSVCMLPCKISTGMSTLGGLLESYSEQRLDKSVPTKAADFVD